MERHWNGELVGNQVQKFSGDVTFTVALEMEERL